jgi:pimeloyl-ACP methyl ester carboxylesterase
MTQVVLAPGLWMPAAAMALLRARLARCGYSPRVYAYRGRDSLEANVEQLARFTRETTDGRAAHFVGHSLGGVLIFDMLSRHPDIKAASVLLLGAPVRGCLAGRRLGAAALGRWMMGECRSRWVEREARWQRDEPVGVVAGTLPLGLGRGLGPLPGPNDGVVCVEETTVEGMTARSLVPLGHSMLIMSGRSGALIERFLGSGRFE